MPHQLSNVCSLIDRISLSSVGHINILFKSLRVKKVFMIHVFESRYILLDEKPSSCIKEPQKEENNIVTVDSRGGRRDKASFELPISSPCFDRFNK